MRLNEVIGSSSIREIQNDDLEMILEWRNSDDVRKMMTQTTLISKDEHFAYFEKIKNLMPPQQILYCFCGQPVGVISDSAINQELGIMDAGYYLGVRGLPLKASFGIIYCSLDYAFDVLHAKKILGTVRKNNITSITLDKKCGYMIIEKDKNDPLKEDFYDAIIDADTWNSYKAKIRRIL